MSYWVDRATKENRKLYESTLEDFQKECARNYKNALKGIKADIITLFDTIADEMKDGDPITMDQLYRYNRFLQLQKRLNKELTNLGEKEIKLSQQKYELMGQYCNSRIYKEAVKDGAAQSSFLLLDDEKIKNLVSSIWCNDGKHWSARVWDNQKRLQSSIEKGLLDSLARGLSKDEMVKDLQKRFDVGFSNADRIARTELAYIQEKTAVESYKKAGITEVKTIVADDERLCEVCGRKEGLITPIGEARPGKAFLFHPNCRCDIVPVL